MLFLLQFCLHVAEFFGTSADGRTAVTCFFIILSSHGQLMRPLLAPTPWGRLALHVVVCQYYGIRQPTFVFLLRYFHDFVLFSVLCLF
jgi:hypothetical protein